MAAGYSQDVAGVQHPYTVTSNGMGGFTFTNMNPPGSTTGQATSINDAGKVGGFFTDALGVTHGFLDSAGIFTPFDAPRAAFTQILGLNNLGQFVGDYTDAAAIHMDFSMPAQISSALMDSMGHGSEREHHRLSWHSNA